MVDSQEKYNLTTKKIECGHCKTKVFMRIICEGKDSVAHPPYLVCDDDVHGKLYNTEYDYYEWEVLKCLSCSKVNVLQHSSLAVWEYFEDENQPPVLPTETDFLYPSPDLYKEKPLELKMSNEVIEKALSDVEASIHEENKIISGVDRIHTALHGYFRLVCATENISFNRLDDITKLFKLLRNNHPKLQNTVNPAYINDFLYSVSTIIDRLNSIRNNASLAHGNENLLEKDEALFYINIVRLLILYFDKKLMS